MEEERKGGVQEKEKEHVRGKIEKRKTGKNRCEDRSGHMEGKKGRKVWVFGGGGPGESCSDQPWQMLLYSSLQTHIF